MVGCKDAAAGLDGQTCFLYDAKRCGGGGVWPEGKNGNEDEREHVN